MTIIDKLKKDDVFEEDEHLKLRKLIFEDRSGFLRVLKQVSPVPEIFELEGFEDLLWKETLSSKTGMVLAIEKKGADADRSAGQTENVHSAGQTENGNFAGQTEDVNSAGQTENGNSAGQTENGNSAGQTEDVNSAGQTENGKSGPAPVSREERKEEAAYVGECMVKNPEPGILELGVDVGTEYQNRGIGTGAMRLLITGIRKRCPDCRLITRIYSDNTKSIRIIRGLGGTKIGEEPGEHKEAAAVAAAAGRQVDPSSPGLPGSVHIEVFEILP